MNRLTLHLSVWFAALYWATPGATAGSIKLSNPTTETSTSENGFAETSQTPDALVLAAAHTSGSAGAILKYFFAVDGPADTMVYINVTTKLTFNVAGVGPPEGPDQAFYSVFASSSVGTANNTNEVGGESGHPPTSPLSKLSDTEEFVTHLHIPTLTPTEIDLSAGAQDFLILGHPNVSVQAIADPLVEFDPNFDHTGLSLQFSPGIGNGLPTTVPEPSSLILCAVALVGYAWRRRKRAA